jgi:Na+-transporting methylmalonyl-CoA/oxaloacetate decarboxylase gamma subunit
VNNFNSILNGGIWMNRRGTGTVFCLIAALLYSVRYLSAAIYGSGQSSSWSTELFNGLLEYVGYSLVVFSLISLVVGIVYLVSAEREERKGKDIEKTADKL